MKNFPIYILISLTLAFNALALTPISYEFEKVQIEDHITPLMGYAKEGDIDALKKDTLESLDSQSERGMTALHYATKFHQEEAACLLIERGANPLILDDFDDTPLSIARRCKLQRVAEALETSIIEGCHLGIHDTSNDKHFIVLVASYNNENWVEQNLSSILSQNYKKYTVVYLNDMSTDGTVKKVRDVISSFQAEKRVILMDNSVKRWCLGNYIFAIERFCPNKSVIVLIDGDDWLRSDKKVQCNSILSKLNSIYQNPNIWLTFGDSFMIPAKIKTPHCRDITNMIAHKNFRNECKTKGWPIHHLRTFYASLFRMIRPVDFLDADGQIFKHTEDVAYMLPMIEMAGTRVKFLPFLWYTYNLKNPLVTSNLISKSKLSDTYYFICNKPPYSEIDNLDSPEKKNWWDRLK